MMFDWISRNSDTLQVLLNGLMVAIWVVYLQIFLVSFRRKQRSEILINMSAGAGLSARCFVSNLSLEPLYLHDVLVELTTGEGAREAVVTDRTEMTDERLNSPSEVTNQGPLKSGDYIDIGSFEDIIERASRKLPGVEINDIKHLRITALAKTASSPEIVGACREYRLRGSDGRTEVIPTRIAAKQIRSWWGRWKLRRKIKRHLEER